MRVWKEIIVQWFIKVSSHRAVFISAALKPSDLYSWLHHKTNPQPDPHQINLHVWPSVCLSFVCSCVCARALCCSQTTEDISAHTSLLSAWHPPPGLTSLLLFRSLEHVQQLCGDTGMLLRLTLSRKLYLIMTIIHAAVSYDDHCATTACSLNTATFSCSHSWWGRCERASVVKRRDLLKDLWLKRSLN